MTSVKDWPESIINSWIDFERDEGTLEQMELCEAKTKERLDKVNEERQKAQQALSQDESSMQNKKASKRKGDDIGKWQNLGASPSKIVKADVPMKPKLRESRLFFDTKAANDSNREESKPKVAPPPGYKTKDDDTDDKNDQHEVNNNVTIFVSNLDYTATEDEVRNILQSIGPIISIRMIKDYRGRSKGYCYVQLSSAVCITLLIDERKL